MMDLIIYQVIIGLLISRVTSQTSNDPILKITQTVPDSGGRDNRIVFGHFAQDAVFNCFAENLRPHHQVNWERYVWDSQLVRRQVHIASDMDTQDNMKWSIEKPTESSWRLRVRSLQWEDQSNYTCYIALGTYGNRIQDYKTLFVVDPPQILQGETSYNQRAEEGTSVTLHCKASGFPKPTIMWRRQGNMNLPSSSGGGVTRLNETLIIESIMYLDQGLYICDVMNSFGSARREVTLAVDYAPKLKPEAEEVGQAVGYQRTLTCHVYANPQPSMNLGDSSASPQIAWMKNDENLAIQSDDRNTLRVIEGAYSRITFELRIFPVIPSDFGMYTCWAKNNRGSGQAQVNFIELDQPVPDKGIMNGATKNTSIVYFIIALCTILLKMLS